MAGLVALLRTLTEVLLSEGEVKPYEAVSFEPW
jgi:hypothetical protein